MNEKYYLGIDGGATKTTFALSNEGGEVLNVIKKGPSNPFDLGLEGATEILREGIESVVGDIPYAQISLFAGLSGGVSGGMKEAFSAFFKTFGFHAFDNGSDLENILSAGLDGETGIALIMGTGSSAFVQTRAGVKRLDGLGYLFSHGGCGYDLGNQGIRAALKSEDGTGAYTLIRDLILQRTGKGTVLEDLGYFYEIGKSGIASYSPIVIEAYKMQDEVAKQIVEKNMAHIAELITTGGRLIGEQAIQVVLVGGLTNEIDLLLPIIQEKTLALDGEKSYAYKVFDGDVVKGALKRAAMQKRG